MQVFEWLCLSCQTQRALKGMEPPVTKPQAEPDTISTSKQPPESLTPKTATDAGETNKKELTQVQEPPKDVSAAAMIDENKAPVPPCVQKENFLITDMKKEALPKINEDKTAEKKETQVQLSSTVEGVSAQRPSSEIMLVKEDQNAAGPQKPIIEQEAVGQPVDTGAEKGRVLEKPEKPQTKPSPREQETLKQESGFFGFGFGSAKSQPAPSKPSETSNRKLGSLTETPSAQSVSAVSGKVLGFGSSILSSASNLISSAVQDESSTTPPSSRKGSSVSQTSVKTPTPPTSRRGSAISQASVKTPPTSRKGSVASQASVRMPPAKDTKSSGAQMLDQKKPDQKSDVKLDGTPEAAKSSAPLQPATKPIQSSCPICKVELNIGSVDPPNFQICTECKNNVCSQCGFDPMPDQTKVRNILLFILTLHTKELPQQKVPAQEKPSKPQPESAKGTPSPIKSAPPPQAEAPKQESSFFGFGLGKSQPTPAKTSDSMTGKLFGFGGLTETASRSPSPQSVTNVSGKVLGFGSSIFSSASNLISSAVQDEPASSPPTSRKGSTVSQSSGKTSTPPTSRKGSAASQASLRMPQGEPKAPVFKKPDEKKTEEPHLTKALPVTAKQKASTEPDKVAAPSEPPSKATPSICKLCKVALNVGSKETPNYNSCTKCKDVVCNLCGFNPMPHLAEAEWLCLNCQTQMALAGKMIDIGQISALSTQQVKTSVNVQATETTLGPTVLKVSQVGTETALAAPASVQTTDAPVHETVDKTPEVKTESPRPADKEEKRVSEEQRQARSFQFANKPIQNEEVVVQVESNPTTPCELDSTVLSVLGDETRTLKVNKEGQDIFSVSPESYSSAEEELKEIHRASESSLRKTASELVYIKDPVSIKQHPTCVENSSESEPSPHLQRGRKLSAASSSSEDFKLDSPDSGDEEFIRRQLMQMSADESLSPKDEETYIRKEIREKEQQMQHEAREAERETTETKPKQIPKKSSVELEESVDNSLISQKQDVQSMHDIPISETIEESVTVVVLNDNEKDRIADNDSAIVISAQQSISIRQITEEESLIEDSEDRSKGDGSSSIQASSITPGTASPTSASSFDEESDSSPSHKKAGAEGKQQMKVKHRQGQALPTIDDSSEGEEIQDKGYQLLQHEQQSESEQHLKMTSQKSKKDELHEQRRLDHPPSNLSSVEVVTQAEDEWQLSEVKIHELYSFSNISPSIESEPENAYTHLLPEEKPLKSAEETYEEMMEKAQALKAMTKNVTPPEIEPLYGGMLIEDYAYESLVEEPAQAAAVESSFTDNQYLSKVIVQETVRKLRTPEEAYEEMQKKRELILEGQTVQHEHVDKAAAQTDPFGPAATDTCYVTMSAYDERSIGKEVESQLNAKPANEEVLKKQKEVLTPGTSPTQSSPLSPVSPISLSEPSYDSPEVILIPSSGEEDNIKDEYAIEPTECAMQPYISESPSEDLSVKKVLYPIPDLKITQCSSGEDEAGDEDSSTQEHEIAVSTDTTQVIYSSVKTEPSAQTQSVEMEPISVLCEVPQTKPVLENVSFWDSTPSPLSPQTSSPDSATSSLRDQTPESGFIPETPTVIESSRAVVPDSAPVTITMPDSVSEPAPQISEVKVHPDAVSFQERASLPQVTTVATAPSPPEVSKLPLAPKPTIVSAVADISVSQQPPIAKQTSAPKTAEVSDTKPPLASKQSPAPMLAEVPVSKPPLAPNMTSTAPSAVVKQTVAPVHKPPPPVPPKPICVPAGLVFSHRSRESVKPPVVPEPTVAQTGRAATLPRTREPPNALSLSLTAPVDSKHSISSPKSPLSPRFAKTLETYVVITLPSEPGSPVEGITTQAPIRRSSLPTPKQQAPAVAPRVFSPPAVSAPLTVVPAPVVAHPDTIPNIVTQVVTTEVQRTTTVSVVQERIPVEPVPDHASMTVIVQPEMTKTQTKPIQNGKMHYPGDVIDLTTLKVNVTMTDKGMDLTAPEASRQSFSSDSSGRQTTAVQPEIVNLSAEITPATTLSVVTDNITIVTCTATITYKDNIADKPLNLGSATSMPLSLTTYKPFEPLAQIVYRPVNSQPKPTTSTEIPVNLSCGATETTADSLPVAPVTCTKAGVPIHTEPSAVEAIDLTTSKPMKAMVALSSSSGIVTTVVEDDAAPVDLTAGRRTVCCDVLYRLPFTGSCRTQPPVTTQPDNQLGFKDDHYQYDNATSLGIKDLSKMVVSMSEVETGLFPYENKNGYGYQNGASDGAIDLTSAKMSTDEALDYSKKGTLSFSTTQGTSFGLNSVLRSSNGVVYSSVSAPIPSTYAITTQPGSIFSTTYNSLSSITEPFSTLQNQPSPYDFIHTTGTNQSIFLDSDPSKDILPSALANFLPSLTAFPELYSDATLEAIAASLDALVSPNFPALDDSKSQQYQAEREFLQLEKLKQLCLAEELEWERQEIQRYREQEQLIVQKELEELQSMKHQLLMQQEEERKAHFILQQETFAQQQLQLEQIHHLQQQLQQQLEEQKIYPYGFEPNEEMSQPTGSGIILDAQYSKTDNGQYWPVKDDNSTSSAITIHDPLTGGDWYTAGSSTLSKLEGVLKDSENSKKLPSTSKEANEESVGLSGKKIAESGVQTDEEDEVEKPYPGRRRRNRRSVDSCVQTDDEDQDEWDVPVRSRRRSRSSRYADGERGKGSKVSSIAVQTVAEISVQTDHSGTIKRSPVRAQIDTTVDLHRGGQTESDSDVTSDKDKRHSTPIEIGVSTHLKADGVGISSVPKSPKVLYSPVSPVSPAKGSQKMLTAEPSRHPSSPRSLKASQRSLSDPKSLSPTTDDRVMYQYSKSSQSGTTVGSQKKVKRTLPHPPPEEDTIVGPSGYSTGSARRRMCRNTTMARAKILQDIDKELDLVERESSKLRKKQAELDEEEKEIDAKLRYLEMGINRRKEALLKEREKRERAYLQGVAEERDYMSDSEVSNIREARGNGHGLERPRTAPQSEFNQFIPPQTEADSQYAQLGSPYSHYQYASQTGTPSHFSQQNLYQQQSLYHQQVSPYQTQSMYSSVPTLNQQSQQAGYDHASQLLLMQQKSRQTTLSDLEPKITTNYEVIRNQPLLIVPTSTESAYGVSHLGGKYGNLDLRLGLEERGSMASSPMSSISAESFYADIDHHNARNYVMIDDIGELTKGSTGLSSSFSIPDKDMSKTDRLLRAAEVRRTSDVTDFLGPLQAASRLHSYGKPDEDSMEEPYELKLLKQQIKQEFRRGTDGLEQLTGLPHYLHADSFRHFPKSEKYSIGRLTLEKQAAKQLPASVLYQKQLKNKRALIDPKITKFSPIQESRDLEPDYSGFLASTGSAVGGLSSRARLLQDEITFGLRKNIAEQQKYLGSTLSTNLTQSLTLGQSLNLGPTLRSSLQDDGTYPSGTRSRPSSRPSSVYGLDLSIKRDLSSSSLRLKTEGESIDSQFGMARAKPTSLPISQSRGRIPIVAQNSEEESPLSPVGQPMGMARASAGPLPPISADSRDQFGSSHSLPEVQQHMREESRTRGYDRDIAFIMDDLQGAMSDSEAYHLQHEETDWFDKPREGRGGPHSGQDRRQVRCYNHTYTIHYPFPHTRIKLQRDPKDHTVSGSGMGIRVVGGKEIPGSNGEIGAYIAKVSAGGSAERTGKVVEGMQVLEWNGIPLMGKTYEEVQSIMGQQHSGDVEICVRLDLNMLSDSEHPQQLELQSQLKAGKRSPGVDPKQLAAELQKVSQQQAPVSVLAALEKAGHLHSATASAASSAVPSPGQPGSPSVNKKRHSSKSAEALKPQPHPITGEIQLQINYDKNMGNLIVHVLQARNLAPRDNNGYSDPFVKVYLLPGRSQVMVVQNASAENKRRTKYVQKTQNPEWNQTVIYKNIHLEQLKRKTLEVTVWDYDRYSTNDFLGEVLIDLSNTAQLDNMPRWHPLKEQSESIHHSRGHPPQGGSEQSPKTSVIKSRSHGIFPDPAKDTQVPTIEKSHSSPGSSKSSSEGHLRSHGPSRSQSKSSVTQAHLEDAGNAIAAAEAAVQQARLQPNRAGHRLNDGDDYTLDSEDGTGTNMYCALPNHIDLLITFMNYGLDKNQMMGEIKVALKREMKTEGEQLVLEILQCRNITYKFKSPDHLPDLYVKLYVVNVATQKRIIKKKTRVCRHDREPSFNETFRFSLNPAGHSIQLFLVSNGGKFMKKTLIGEAYIWLDKVDMRKRAVSWHKLVASSPHTQP
uniref:Protein piccolo n=1 Tax=Pygocentrus nattereri TaxID=42514 RepID=A0AAR2L7U3_PYGNA